MAMHFVRDALVQKHRLEYRNVAVHDPAGVVPTVRIVCEGRPWTVRVSQFTGKSQRLNNKYSKALRQGTPITFRGRDTCQSALDSFLCWIRDDHNRKKNYDLKTTTRQKCRTCVKHGAAAFDHRENFYFGYQSRCYEFCELSEQKFEYALTRITLPDLQELKRQLERHERPGERRLRNALRRFLGKDELPDIPFPADDDEEDDDDDDDDEGFGGDDDLPGPGNGGPGAGPDDGGSDNDDDEDDDDGDLDNNNGGRAAAPRRASHQSRHNNNYGEGGLFVGTPALPIEDSIEDEFPRSPRRRNAEAGNTRRRILDWSIIAKQSIAICSQTGTLVDDEDELDHLGPDLPGSLANGSRRGLPSTGTPRGRAAGGRQATESTEIKQETPCPSKRKEPGGPEHPIDLTGDDSVEIKKDPDGPRNKQPCISQDIGAVLDLTSDDEEVRDVTAQYASQAEHRLRCPRCESFFQAKLPRMSNYRHACPPGPVVAEHSNEQSFEAWTQRYQDRRSQPI